MTTHVTAPRRLAAMMACLTLTFGFAGCDNGTPGAGVPNTPAQTVQQAPSVPAPTMTLNAATFANNLEQVKANIAYGADLNELVPDGDRGSYSALHAASRAGYADIARALVEAGADVNIAADAPHRATPLHWACRANQLELVKILVEGGADVNNRAGTDGTLTPMRTALDRSFHEVVEYLAQHGGEL